MKYLKEKFTISDKQHGFQYKVDKIFRGHQHLPGGVCKLLDAIYAGKTWLPLTNEQRYQIEPYSVFTCLSASEGLGLPGDSENAFSVIEIDQKGDWFITPHIEKR